MSSRRRSISRGSRSREELNLMEGRIPKKSKNGERNTGAVTVTTTSDNTASNSTDDPLDALAQARKAMMIFQEVTGESVDTKFHALPSRSTAKDSQNGHGLIKSCDLNASTDHKRDESMALKQEEEKKLQKEELELKKDQEQAEEDIRRKQRIIAGEAIRRAFKPKIATAMDALL